MLPDKPSDLIELALADLIKCERSPKYEIDMSFWHAANGICTVCLAGSVMAQSLGVSYNKNSLPSYFESDEKSKLRALDCLRNGNVEQAFSSLGKYYADGEKFGREITTYSSSPGKFKRQMRKLARDLRAGGF